MSDFPFTEDRSCGTIRRKFSNDIEDEELIWHRDAHGRIVRVLEAHGWYLQLDDELPMLLEPGNVHFIPARAWHRVLKRSACGDLVVEIVELAGSHSG